MAFCNFCDRDETECDMGLIGHTYCCSDCNDEGVADELRATEGQEWREWEILD